MAASGRTDDLEIIFNHIELLTSKLEIFHTMTGPRTAIGSAFESSGGKHWIKHLDSYCDAMASNSSSLPKMPSNSSITNFLKSIQEDLVIPMQHIKYAFQFCQFTEYQLKMMLSYVKDLDMRWNQYLTIRCCQIFVMYCKTVLFIKMHPIMKYISATVNQYKSKCFEQFNQDISRITQFTVHCSNDPFGFIHQKLPVLSDKMARLSSSVGTFIARLFGTFPLIEWDSLSIFNRTSKGNETTLVSDEFIILQNIKLLKETLFFFLFVFPENTQSNQCFELIIEGLLTESPTVYLTPNFKVPLQQIIALSKPGAIPERVCNNATENARQKFLTSHLQRIMHVTFLLQDCLNISSFDPNQLPFLMNHIIALSSLAYYELDNYFTFIEEEIAKRGKDCIHYVEGMELLSVLMEVINLVDQYEEDIRRFYVYNLATIDLQFLQKQLNPSVFNQVCKSKEHNLAKLIDDLALGLEGIDLEEYDNGYRYEFTGFLLTHGRYLRIFNEIKMRERVSFIDPIFEHLTTIRMHCMFAQSPMNAFLTFCPIQTLWNHSSIFSTIINNQSIPLSIAPSILHLFTYFSRDLLCLRQLLGEVKKLNEMFPRLRSSLYQRLNTYLCTSFNSEKPLININLQTHDFSQSEATAAKLKTLVNHGGMTLPLVEDQTLSLNEINQVKQFCSRIPHHVVLFDKIDQTAEFFSNTITKGLASFLFPESFAPDPSTLDMSFSAAAQYLWTFFASLGSSFPRQMFQCRISESNAKEDTTSFTEQVKYLDGTINCVLARPNEKKTVLESKNQRLIMKIEEILTSFLKDGWKNSIYLSTLKGFWSTIDLKYEPSLFLSQNAFRHMIHNMGLHGGFRIYRILIHRAAKSIMKIIKVFNDMKNIDALLDDFNKKDTLPPEMPTSKGGIETSSKELIILGICMQLRAILREEMCNAVNEAAPGLKSLIDASLYRINTVKTSEQSLISEMVSGNNDDLIFIEKIISKQKKVTLTNLNQFFFFLGLNFIGKRWIKSKYLSNYDAITENMHLLPIATKVLIHELPLFFDPNKITTKAIHDGYLLFFSVMAQIVQMRKSKKLNDSARALTILADMYPRVMKLEYGIIEDSFPTRSVNFAYSQNNTSSIHD